MAELKPEQKALLDGLSKEDIATYLQTKNEVAASDTTNTPELTTEQKQLISGAFKFSNAIAAFVIQKYGVKVEDVANFIKEELIGDLDFTTVENPLGLVITGLDEMKAVADVVKNPVFSAIANTSDTFAHFAGQNGGHELLSLFQTLFHHKSKISPAPLAK